MTLLEIIQASTLGRKIHISVHDLTGVLQHPELLLPMEHTIHACKFCDNAKKTTRGYFMCIHHKEKVNQIALRKKRPFWGYCPYGLQELVYPVNVNGKIICILYIGKFNADSQIFRERIQKSSKISGGDPAKLLALESECENASAKEYLGVAKMLAEHICMTSQKPYMAQDSLHWAVQNTITYAEHYFENQITISQISILCGMNAKYLGRLFLKQVGVSFSEYLNKIRIGQAKKLLQENIPITEIALACGFSEASYFNRMFQKYENCTPGEYRKSIREH